MHPAAHPRPNDLKALAEKSRTQEFPRNPDRGGPATPLLSVTGLTKHFPLARGAVVRVGGPMARISGDGQRDAHAPAAFVL